MNYLAHAYLSFGDPEILAGNMFSDFVKGRKKFDYPTRIQAGIELHRAIDQFTDDHPATKNAKKFFKAAYGLYSAPFIDVVYDHFLARDESIFSGDELKFFANGTYKQLDELQAFFPDRFRNLYPYMKSQDWLSNYQYAEGIFRSFGGLVYRARYMTDPEPAIQIFLEQYEPLRQCYREFFPSLKVFALEIFSKMN